MVLNTKEMNTITMGVEEIIKDARFTCRECLFSLHGKDNSCRLFYGNNLEKGDDGEYMRKLDCIRIFGKGKV